MPNGGEIGKAKARRRIAGAVACALLLAPPAPAALPVAVPEPAPAAAPDCAAIAAERTALEAEHRAVRMTISDIALGRNRPRPKVGAGDVAGAAAGTIASLLLPFGIGLAASAAAGAAGKSGKKKKAKRPPPPEPDVPALIARQQDIEAALRGLAESGCP